MEKCSPKGRDCFEKHSSQTFNCSATCEGVYAHVLWEDDQIMNTEGNKIKRGKEMDKQKFLELIDDYKQFKRENVRHFRFHSIAPSSAFGKS